MPNKGKQIQKRVNDVNEKRKKINEIEQKYDLNDKNAQKKGASRGYSNQDRERIKNKPKNSSISRKVTANEKQEDISKVELNASKITTQKRDAFKSKKGNEMTSEKIVYKSKRNINDDMIDEKLRTQTFRFTNQFKSEDGGDPNYFKGEEHEDENVYGEFIEEEIETKSQDSPRNINKQMKLTKTTGPQDIPSDTNPFKNKRNANDESADISDVSMNKPPKVPSKVNTSNMFQSPAQQIFKTSKQKQNDKNQK